MAKKKKEAKKEVREEKEQKQIESKNDKKSGKVYKGKFFDSAQGKIVDIYE